MLAHHAEAPASLRPIDTLTASLAIEAAGDRVSVANEGSGTEPRVYYIDFEEDVFDNGRDIRLESGRQYDVPGV